MSSREHKMKIWNLIKDMKIGMLATRHDNDLRARPMYLVQDDYDGTLWFFTDLDAEKVGGLNDQAQHVTHQVRCCHDSLLSPPLC